MISWLATTQSKHQRVKTLLFVLCIICFFTVPVFAANTGAAASSLETLQSRLHKFLSILSRAWIVLAILAGKLMTNQWVYGSFMHLDIYLWKIWNIIKNFTNFALMGVLLWQIIKGLTGTLNAKKIITKTLIAGVLIQASWFMLGALLDISSIAISAVSAFPTSFFGSDSQMTQQAVDDVKESMYNKNYVIKMNADSTQNIQNAITTLPLNQATPALSDDEALQSILPNSSSVSGPLIFLGMSAFKFQNYMSDNNGSPEAITIGFLLKALVIVMYTLGLALLFVANLIRIVFLWMFIILSPVLVLANVFKEEIKIDALKSFSLSSLLWLVFRPVLFVLSLSFSLIVIVSLQNIMTDIQGKSLNGVQMTQTANGSAIQVQGLSTLEVSNGTLFKETTTGVQNTFADLIIFLLSIFLVWYLIKWSVTTGEGPGQDIMKKMTGFIQEASKSLPVFGGFSANQISTARDKTKEKTLEGFKMDRDGTFGAANTKFDKQINKWLNLYDNRDTDDIKFLKSIAKPGSGGDFFAASIERGKERNGGVSLSTAWRSALEDWLKKPENIRNNDFRGSYTDFESFFKGDGDHAYNRWRLHYLMSGGRDENEKSKRAYSETNAPKYEDLLANHYFQPKEERTE